MRIGQGNQPNNRSPFGSPSSKKRRISSSPVNAQIWHVAVLLAFALQVFLRRHFVGLNAPRKHFSNFPCELLLARFCQRRALLLRMNARRKKNLVRVNVADACDDGLVVQHFLDRLFARSQLLHQIISGQRGRQRFQSKRCPASCGSRMRRMVSTSGNSGTARCLLFRRLLDFAMVEVIHHGRRCVKGRFHAVVIPHVGQV